MLRTTALLLLLPTLTRCADRSVSQVHTGQDCRTCHAGWQFRLQPPARCLSCHPEISARIAAGHGYHAHGEARVQRCGSCHVEHAGPSNSGWKQGPEEFRRNHEADTGFALDGAHQDAPCAACHRNTPSGRRSYVLATPACQSCHDQPHRLARSELTCQRCHDTQSWTLPHDLQFDHRSDTRFLLTGSHAALACGACHGQRPPVFARSASAVPGCVSCHAGQDPHRRRVGREPAHRGPAAKRCERCHDPLDGSWSGLRKTP